MDIVERVRSLAEEVFASAAAGTTSGFSKPVVTSFKSKVVVQFGWAGGNLPTAYTLAGKLKNEGLAKGDLQARFTPETVIGKLYAGQAPDRIYDNVEIGVRSQGLSFVELTLTH